MGGVPMLLMVTLYGTLSVQPHLGVCVSQTTDVQSFSEARSSNIKSLSHGIPWVGTHADQVCGYELAVCVVADRTSVGDKNRSAEEKPRDLQQPNDSSPVVIPELGKESAELVLNAARNSRVITVRKPDNSGVAGSGFSFPSVPPSLAEAGQALTQNVDRAGRPIDPAASARGATNGTTLPSTTTVSSPGFPVPPFTGSAEATPNVPASPSSTSTASARATTPTSSPDNATRTTNWGQFPLPTTAPATASTSAFGVNTATAANAATAPAVGSAARGAGASPLLPTDTFGRTPNGLATATTGRPAQSAYSTVPQSTTNAGTPGFVHVPTTDSIFSRNHTANATAASGFGAGSSPTNSAQGASATNNLNTARSTSLGPAVAGVPVGQPPMGRFGANPSASFSQPSSSAFSSAASTNPAATAGFSASRPDARLTAAQVAAGAWSVDAFGQPVDRTGQRIASAPVSNHGQRFNQHPQTSGPVGFGSSFADQTATHLAHVRPQAAGGNRGIQADMTVPKEGASKFNQPSGNEKPSQSSGTSVASRTSILPQVPENQVIENKPVTTQPLFNGLLLISIVANIYLIFWLKNLRLQYHEMVAAKRMASSSTSSN